MSRHDEDPPFEGGAQPVKEEPPEMPAGGSSVLQTVVIVVGVLVLLAGLLWILIPILGG